MSQNDFVAAYGLEHLDLSLRALYELTKRFTAEGAIRAFLQAYPEQTLARLTKWAADPNCHVRRLVSEGARPRLPLAPRLPAFVKDTRPVLALLERLKAAPVLIVLHREIIRWYEPNRGYASSAEEGNAFGLTNDLTLVSVEPSNEGTIMTWSQYYDAQDLELSKAVFDQALADIGENLVRRFEDRVLERYVEQ